MATGKCEATNALHNLDISLSIVPVCFLSIAEYYPKQTQVCRDFSEPDRKLTDL